VAVDASLGWSHELGGTIRTAPLSLAGAGFTIAGAGLSADGADFALGLSTPVFGQGEASLHYEGIVGGSGSSHAVSLGLRFSW
jgi:uncharacterized protein with beta-barrel porin domain